MKLKWLFPFLVLGVFFLTPLTSFAATVGESWPRSVHVTKPIVASFLMSAFAVSSSPTTSQSGGVSPQRQAITEGKIKPDFGTFELQPGQESWIHLSAQQKKSFHSITFLHIQTGKGTRTAAPPNTLTNAAVQPNSAGCRYGTWITESSNLWSFTISIDFCWNGSSITYISPVHVSYSACCLWGMSNDGTGAYDGGTWGYAWGYYTATFLGGASVHHGYEEIDIDNNGGYSFFGY